MSRGGRPRRAGTTGRTAGQDRGRLSTLTPPIRAKQRSRNVGAAAGIRNLLMIGGDAHMLAIDDGSHSDYSGRGGAGFPVFHAAPLDRPGEIKGGPYTLGPRTQGGQFGLVTVQDPGRGPVTVTLSGRTYTGAEVMRYQFTSPRPASRTG